MSPLKLRKIPLSVSCFILPFVSLLQLHWWAVVTFEAKDGVAIILTPHLLCTFLMPTHSFSLFCSAVRRGFRKRVHTGLFSVHLWTRLWSLGCLFWNRESWQPFAESLHRKHAAMFGWWSNAMSSEFSCSLTILLSPNSSKSLIKLCASDNLSSNISNQVFCLFNLSHVSKPFSKQWQTVSANYVALFSLFARNLIHGRRCLLTASSTLRSFHQVIVALSCQRNFFLFFTIGKRLKWSTMKSVDERRRGESLSSC